jgi:hypothetical protein
MTELPTDDADVRWSEDLLDQVAGLLQEQLDHVRRGDFDAVSRTGERIDVLIRMATDHGGIAVGAGAREKIGHLQASLELTVRQRLSEVGEARTRLRQGRNTLQAYRRGVGD